MILIPLRILLRNFLGNHFYNQVAKLILTQDLTKVMDYQAYLVSLKKEKAYSATYFQHNMSKDQ